VKMDQKEFLQVFWDLAAVPQKTRVDAVAKLLEALKADSGACNLEYSLKRLVRGLGSGRDAARQGFAAGLSQLLKNFPEVTLLKVCFCAFDFSNQGIDQDFGTVKRIHSSFWLRKVL
jgi:hypothetical protein